MLFVTTPHTTVAMNATNCSVIWRAVDQSKQKDVFPVNRGVAYLDGRLFRGTPDGRLQAPDAKTGKVVWDVQAGDPKVGEFLSSAPIAWNGTVFTGVAGSDWGVRGHMMAFDAATGKVLLTYPTGGGIAGGVITYAIGGKQYVAATSGNVSRTTFKTTGSPTMIVMALNAPTTPHRDSLAAVSPISGGTSPTEHAQDGVAHGSAGDSVGHDSMKKP